MADSPSPIASSSAGAPLQAKEAADAREAGRRGGSRIARSPIGPADETGAVVETDDADSRVFADSEGTGSQGRELTDGQDHSGRDNAVSSNNSGITTDKDGHIHLDLQA